MSLLSDNSLSSIQILRVSADAVLPTRAHPDDAGLDLYNLEAVTLIRNKVAKLYICAQVHLIVFKKWLNHIEYV